MTTRLPIRLLTPAALALAGLLLLASAAGAQCTYAALTSGNLLGVGGTPAYFSFTQNAFYWSAVGIRPDAGSDWDISLYQSTAAFPTCVSTLLASSTRGGSSVDLVVGDFNHDPTGTYYPVVSRFAGGGATTMEWEDGADLLNLNDALVSRTWTPSNVVEIWDVFLVSGTPYTFRFHSTSAGHKLLLFANNAGGTYFVGRSSAVFEATADQAYTPTSTGYFGVAVINDDGTSGTFTLGVGECTTPAALSAGVTVTTGAAENYYSFNQLDIYWTAVGVRGATSDYDIQAYSTGSGGTVPTCLSGLLTGSAFGFGTTDFVVGDFNQNPLGTYYVRPFLFQDLGTPTAQVQWDSGADVLTVNGPWVNGTASAGHLLDVWDVYLVSGTAYTFHFNRSGAANTSMWLFRNTAGGVYWAGRGSAVMSGTSDVVYTAPATGFYGLVVVNDDGGSGTYQVGVGLCNTPVALTASTPVMGFDDFGWYSFNQVFDYWTALGTRSGGADYDVSAYQSGGGGTFPTCFSTLLANSNFFPPTTDFIVGDFNANPTGTYYYNPYVFGTGPTPGGTSEWDSGADQIFVGGSTVHRTVDGSHVLEAWDVFLSSGSTYTFRFNPYGPANLKLLLFRNPSPGTSYWAGRSTAEFEVAAPTTYLAPTSEFYGAVVVNDNGLGGFYDLRVDLGVVAVDGQSVPATTLSRASPNPTRGSLRLDYALARPAALDFEVHDMQGRLVAQVPAGSRAAGSGSVEWDGRSSAGSRLPAGLYFVRMKADGMVVGEKRVTLLE